MNLPEISDGISASIQTAKQTGKSIKPACLAIGSDWPEIIEHSGIINVKSKILAPMILPKDNDDCFLLIAVIVVTSSGSDVPIAISVRDIILSDIPTASASKLPLSTSKSAPYTIAAAPTMNFVILMAISLPLIFCNWKPPDSLGVQ